jgi:hypothetical protein
MSYDLIDRGSKRKLLTRRPGRPMALTKLFLADPFNSFKFSEFVELFDLPKLS